MLMYKRDENHQTFWNSRGMTTMCVSSNPPISVSEKIAQIKTWSNQYMEEIALLKNEKSRFLLRCSVIDAFSQSAFPNSHHISSSFSSFLEKFSDPRNDPLPFSDDIGESSFHKERDYRSGYGEEAGRSSGKGLLGPVSRRHRAFLTFPAQII